MAALPMTAPRRPPLAKVTFKREPVSKFKVAICDLEQHQMWKAMISEKPKDPAAAVPMEKIERSIHLVRGQKVILAADLAELYGVVAWRLNEQVKRNKNRFPADFVFQLTYQEVRALTSQFARSKPGRGGRRTLPCAFTEHGAVMAANVLNSTQAMAMSRLCCAGLYQTPRSACRKQGTGPKTC